MLYRKKSSKNKLSRTSFIIGFSCALFSFLSVLFFLASPQASVHENIEAIPLIDYSVVRKQNARIPILTHGTTQAKSIIPLISEVNGKVEVLNRNFASGAFFKQGEVLLQIDPIPYKLDVVKKQSLVDKAMLNLKQVQAAAAVAARNGRNTASLGLHKPQLKHAKSELAAAEASLQLAQYKLANTRVTAPFDGRVAATHVGLGQYLQQGQSLAEIYNLNIIEVRLPIADRQLAFLQQANLLSANQPELAVPVKLTSYIAGSTQVWQGQIVRAEGGRDENGLLYLVAQIPQTRKKNNPPLSPGVFVEAEIRGQLLQNVAVLPPEALSSNNQVWLIDNEQRLRLRQVQVIHRGKDAIYIQQGLENGDNVALNVAKNETGLAMHNRRVKLNNNLSSNQVAVSNHRE